LPDLSREESQLLIAHLKEYIRSVGASGDYDEARTAQSLLDDLVRANRREVYGRSEAAQARYRAARADLEEESA
jgi:hypothetical protein